MGQRIISGNQSSTLALWAPGMNLGKQANQQASVRGPISPAPPTDGETEGGGVAAAAAAAVFSLVLGLILGVGMKTKDDILSAWLEVKVHSGTLIIGGHC